ncbi:MAG: SDR family NAD(P)-dependent oxidoreductase, partial [Algicola sp.]|nr:SDR family NAD(P)-dependent oxidoreductase [Algicola sp.]
DENYQAFTTMGVNIGPAHQGIVAIDKGENQLLAQLSLPSAVKNSQNDYQLHPSLMDSALQATIGLIAQLDQLPSDPQLPFALDNLRIVGECSDQMYAWLRRTQNNDKMSKLDIDLCDDQGNICVQLQGFASRTLSIQDKTVGTLMAVPAWQASTTVSTNVEFVEQHVIVCEHPHIDKDLGQRFNEYALRCFELIKQILAGIPQGKVLMQVVVNDPLFTGLSGLLKSTALENPNFVGQIILTSAQINTEQLAAQLQDERSHTQDAVVRYHQGKREVIRWQEMPETQVTTRDLAPIAFKDKGVYLITGGLGGLGMLFAKEILAQTTDSRIILTGRSALNIELDSLVEYKQVDITDGAQVKQLMADIGQINGIIHSAGMIDDSFIVNKTTEQFSRVLAAKVQGTVNLDEASKDMTLDFMVLFSSGAGVLGNVGQSDYATANAFMDQFAVHRNQQRAGRTLAINWPFWREGGMTVDEANQQMMRRTIGMLPMETASGMQAFYRSLASEHSQVLVMAGDLPQMRRTFLAEKTVEAKVVATVVEDDQLLVKTQQFLIKQFSQLLEMPIHEIDAQAALEDYGIDSVLAMKLTSELEQTFGSLSKTLFFEYQTITALAGYFAASFPQVLSNTFGHQRKGHQQKFVAKPTVPVASVKQSVVKTTKNRFLRAQSTPAEKQIAIVGLGGKYPQADNLDEFWDNLKTGRDCVTEIPAERWDQAAFFDERRNQPGKSYSKWGGFINDVDKFDSIFFNIAPKEAELTDPQERLFIETVWQTIEDAGYSKSSLSGKRIGVYVGVMWGQYELLGAGQGNALIPGSSYASIANRVSYFFNFNGPSMALDTMCSSSLTAIHMASEEIRRGEIDAAIAGGVNVSIHPNKYLTMSQGNFAASDGKCRSFGAGGDGYVPGEGVGAIMLKPLDVALQDGDQVYGIIKSSAINHGGKTNGYTVPNPVAQGELIEAALNKANIDASSISYIETHGTGTSLGDPIEITGLSKAFGGRSQACPIGSVKSNIGHLESAAGIAALTKALLQIKHQQLVPSLHADPLNPNIDFENSPFYVQTQLSPWLQSPDNPRRIGVSSFGAGGANAHLIVEEFVDTRVKAVPEGYPEAFVLSAKNTKALVRYAHKMVAFIDDTDVGLIDMAYTLQAGRTAMNERLVIVADSLAVLKDKLNLWLSSESAVNLEDVYYGNIKKAQSNAMTLIEGEAGKAFLQVILDNRELAKIAELWISGVKIDWPQLYRHTHPSRVSLPTYPFAKDRCWYDAKPLAVNVKEQPEEQKSKLYYTPQWQVTPLASDNAQLSGEILMLGAKDDLMLSVEKQLKLASSDITVTWVESGELPQNVARFSQVIHKCSDDQSLDSGLYTLFNLCKTMMLQKRPSLQILSVFESKGETSAPQHAALGGFFKTLSLENPNYVAKLVEIRAYIQGKADAGELIVNELKEADWQTKEIRHNVQDKQRYVRNFLPFNPSNSFTPAKNDITELPLKQHGVYIVSGGLGGLGYIFSEYLVKSAQAKLVLFGRSALSDKHQQKIDRLKAFGTDILYVQADASKLVDMQNVVTQAKTRFKQINGVIHSAGINADNFMLNKTVEEMAGVLAPKVYGTLNLDEATKDEALDWFVLFSSVAGVMGNPGQCDYAYANQFVDTFAANRTLAKDRSGKTLSINWPLWQAGGMSVSEENMALSEQHSGISPLPTKLGIEYWQQLLQSDISQGVVLYGLQSKIQSHLGGVSGKVAKVVKSQSSKSMAPELLAQNTQDYLKGLISEETGLELERIDADERFESFGIDSMMINRFNANLERDLGELPKTLLYQYESITELTEYLTSQSQAALMALFDIAATPVVIEQSIQVQVQEQVQPKFTGKPILSDDEQIAIIGLHGYYPQSADMDEYWQNLTQGKDLIEQVPANRWDCEAFYDADPARAVDGKIYGKWGGFLDDFDKFDPLFFNISAQEANMTDPQERLFLTSVWASIEDAGYTPDSLKKHHPKGKSADVGVFVGVTTNSYNLLAADQLAQGKVVNPGALPWSIANRVSYFFDWQGPSMPVDTACSSSLVAMHMACESLAKQECQLAVAGGVNLYLHPSKYQSFCQRKSLSQTGKTFSFGAGDDGFVPGEGIGSIVLKPLSKAIERQDRIYGVIAASAFEHSGRSNGYSAPNPNSQARLISKTLDKAQLDPEQISYIEGHGTGTQLGDSLEIAAITQAFGQ